MKLSLRLFWFLCCATFSMQSDAAPKECTSYALYPPSYSIEEAGSRIEVSNMPKVRDQGPLPICHAFASTTIAQRAYCHSKTPPLSCQNLDKKIQISPLSMLANAYRNTNIGLDNSGGNHTNLRMIDGGDAAEALANAVDYNRSGYAGMNTESCYPYDQFVAKYGSEKDTVEKIFGDLKHFYEKYKKQKTEGTYCEECAMQEFAKDFNEKLLLGPTVKDINRALSLDDFPQFIYRLYLTKCPDFIVFKPKAPKFESYPVLTEKGLDNSPNDYESKMKVIKSVLKDNLPMALDGVCSKYENCKCVEGHSLVISGYKRLCKPTGECREVLKVQNSYGEEWQKKYEDGWVDAKILLRDGKTLDNLDGTKDRRTILSWYRYLVQ